MLGISSISSAGATADYFAKDNYYSLEKSEQSSQWFGKGSKNLNLQGTVKSNELQNVLEGKVGESVLGKGEHNAGRDFTFSMPKSASILALVGGDRRISSAYLNAVKEGMSYVENNLIVTRQRDDKGNRLNVKTGNAIMAMFPHDTSRAQDANAHIHVLVANATKTTSGEYKAINFYPIYNVRYELNQIVQERFRNSLHKLGYKTVNKDTGGHFEIVGVPKRIRDHFSKRSSQIKDALKDTVNPNWTNRQNAAYNTRPSKGSIDRPALTERWKKEASDLGFHAEKFVNSIDRVSARDVWNSVKSTTSAVFNTRHPHLKKDSISLASIDDITKYTISALSEQNTTFSRTQIIAEVSAISQGSFKLSQIQNAIKEQSIDGELVQYKENKYFSNKFTTKSLIRAENSIVTSIEQGKGTSQLYTPTTHAVDRVEDTTLTDLHIDDKRTGQKVAAHEILFGTDYITGVQGYAGVGKTYMLSTVMDIASSLNSEQNIRNNFIGLAPTDAAVEELKNKANLQTAQTFQLFMEKTKSLTNSSPINEALLERFSDKTLFLDEASMISVKDMDRFLKVSKLLNVKKVVLIGDVDQIKSLQAGAAFSLMQSKGMKTVIVDEILRQNNPRILEAVKSATDHNISDSFSKLDDYVRNHRNPIKEAAKLYVESLSSDIRTKIITPENKTIAEITSEIRRLLQEKNVIGKDNITLKSFSSLHMTNLQKKALSNYKVGDSLLFHRSVSRGAFKAGSIHKITSIDRERNVFALTNIETNTKSLWKHKTNLKSYPFDVVRSSNKDFSDGDRIKFTITSSADNVVRNQTGVITKIDSSTITFKTENDKNVSIPNDSLGSKGLTHDYASTVYSNQGKSRENVVLVMFSKAYSSTYQNFYVGISRAVDKLRILTDNKSDLQKTIARSASNPIEHALHHENKLITSGITSSHTKDTETSNERPQRSR